ncbi:MAG: hypothetical protein ACJA11_003545 [Glaciecola sp.]|jgi:hypothetical protein
MYPKFFSILFGLSATILFFFQTNALADPTPQQAIEKQLPDLLNMIQERQSVLKLALNKQGMNYQTFNKSTEEKATEIPVHLAPATTVLPDFQAEAFKDGLRDPFTATKKMVEQASVENGTSTDFQISSLVQTLPKLSLRGIIMQAQKSSPLALLDIAGNGVHMVRIGDEISFNAADPKQVLKIQSITRLSVTVEIGTLGDLIIVR